MMPKYFKRIYPYLICIISGMFIFYKYLLQISPSVIGNDLMRDFHLTGESLGNLTACFLYAYMLMQIPAGIILDKYNPRTVIVTAITASAIFTLLFVSAHSTLTAVIARAGIGLATAFAFSGYLKVVTLWVPPKHFALMANLGFTIAMFGAISSQAPLGWLVIAVEWRKALALVAMLGCVLAFICWLLLNNHPPNEHTKAATAKNLNYKQFFSALWVISKNKQNWLLGLYCGFAFGPFSSFGGLWGVPFLQVAYHLPKITATGYISWIYLGIIIGCPLSGWISDHLSSRVAVMQIGMLVALLSMTSIIYFSNILPLWALGFLLFCFGFGTSTLMLCFVLAVETQTAIFAASLITFINTIPSVFEAITEPLIGKLLDLNWGHEMLGGARFFSASDYHVALAVLPLYLISALILLFFIKEKA